ncbi:hypothetical protein D068_cds21390 [Bacillus atrophaeus UCMB-5137]|nr:hypothetical protein D068_cds21390 [Bacillus atrophaeus UCMB-5137]
MQLAHYSWPVIEDWKSILKIARTMIKEEMLCLLLIIVFMGK